MASTPPSEVCADGTMIWKRDGMKHRDGDKPALIDYDGSLAWFTNGVFCRDGMKPASLHTSGVASWSTDGHHVSQWIITSFSEEFSLRFAFLSDVYKLTQ